MTGCSLGPMEPRGPAQGQRLDRPSSATHGPVFGGGCVLMTAERTPWTHIHLHTQLHAQRDPTALGPHKA